MPFRYFNSAAEAKAATSRSQEIDKELRESGRTMIKGEKLLLLGAPESGKTTILKQLILQHSSGFTEKDRLRFRTLAYRNILMAVDSLLIGLIKYDLAVALDVQTVLEQVRSAMTEMAPETYRAPIRQTLVDLLGSVWNDATVKHLFEARKAVLSMQDTAKYFLDNIPRITESDYVPNDVDILSIRSRTDTVTETRFVLKDCVFTVYDIGGHKINRICWSQYFDDATAVIFVVAVSSFDQFVDEGGRNNRLKTALMLFSSVVDNRYLKNSTIILFLNKIDIFKTKLKIANVRSYFPKFEGEQTMDRSLRFFRRMFTNRMPIERPPYVHATCATDKELMKTIISKVIGSIMKKNLVAAGLLP